MSWYDKVIEKGKKNALEYQKKRLIHDAQILIDLGMSKASIYKLIDTAFELEHRELIEEKIKRGDFEKGVTQFFKHATIEVENDHLIFSMRRFDHQKVGKFRQYANYLMVLITDYVGEAELTDTRFTWKLQVNDFSQEQAENLASFFKSEDKQNEKLAKTLLRTIFESIYKQLGI